MSLQGKVIAVTGGAQGIGLETSKLLLSRGAKVSVADVDETAMGDAQKYFANNDQSSSVRFQKVDVGNKDDVEAWIKGTVDWAGKLDSAANIAAINFNNVKLLREIPDDQWNAVIRVNLTGVFHCMRAELNNMRDGGSIVCLSSTQGVVGWATSAAYAATKHGVIGMVRSASKEEGHRNIRINAVAPGAIDTRMLNPADRDNPDTPISRVGTTTEVARLIAFLLSDEVGFITGSTYMIDGGKTC